MSQAEKEEEDEDHSDSVEDDVVFDLEHKSLSLPPNAHLDDDEAGVISDNGNGTKPSLVKRLSTSPKTGASSAGLPPSTLDIPKNQIQKSHVFTVELQNGSDEYQVASLDASDVQHLPEAPPLDRRNHMGYLREAIAPQYTCRDTFWRSLLWSSIPQGAFMGLVSLAFFNSYVALAKATWFSLSYLKGLEHDPDGTVEDLDVTDPLAPLRLGNGKWIYVAYLGGGGVAIGLLKVLWNTLMPAHRLPRPLPTFIKDVQELKGHDVWIPIPILACSALSLGFGASVGPELAMGAAGTSVGSLLVARNWKTGDENSLLHKLLPDLSHEPEHCGLDGFAGSFGAMFPTQFLSGLLAHELGFGVWDPKKFPHSFLETVVRSGIASSVCYTIFVAFEDRTMLDSIPVPLAAKFLRTDSRPIDMVSGLIIGVLCGLVGLLGSCCITVFGSIGRKIEKKLDVMGHSMGLPDDVLGVILTPGIGGTIVGLLCKAAPMLLSDGADQLGSIILLSRELGLGNVVATGFLKLVTLAISLGFGFVGGKINPLLFTGTCMGIVVHMLVDDVPDFVSIPACMAAVPCAFFPALFTFTVLASFVVVLGGAASAPVFLACVMSYMTVCGIGAIRDVMVRSGEVPTNVSADKFSQENGNMSAAETQELPPSQDRTD